MKKALQYQVNEEYSYSDSEDETRFVRRPNQVNKRKKSEVDIESDPEYVIKVIRI